MGYCVIEDIPGFGKAFVRMSGRRPAPCQFCRAQPHTSLCDAKVGRRTCDAKMCNQCRTHAGEDTDFCPAHAKTPQQEELFFEEGGR